MNKNANFERCADFLARMIEKYGDEVNLPKTVDMNHICGDNNTKEKCEAVLQTNPTQYLTTESTA